MFKQLAVVHSRYSMKAATPSTMDGWSKEGRTIWWPLFERLRAATKSARTWLPVAVDAPRTPLPAPRKWYWQSNRWRQCRPKDQGAGRHCEIVVATHRLANPQWTPSRPPFPRWMELGFAIFKGLDSEFAIYEVFPPASYRMLKGDDLTTITVRVGNFAQGPKDMLDAYVAAATLREFAQGRGCEVGGGDGLGSIILPRPIDVPMDDVLKWPGT